MTEESAASAGLASRNASAVKSADRVLDVLELLSRRAQGATHTDIAASLAIPKSSLTHLLRNLAARGYVQLAGQQRFMLGPALHKLVGGVRAERDATEMARPLVKWLAATTGEAASYNVYREGEVERVAGADSQHALSYRMLIGARFPLYSSSGGKAILASLPDADLSQYIARTTLQPMTAATVRSASELREQLEAIKRDGVAVARDEHTPGVTAIAAAVAGIDGYPVGALNVVLPSVRFTEELRNRCASALKVAASRLHRELSEGSLTRARHPLADSDSAA